MNKDEQYCCEEKGNERNGASALDGRIDKVLRDVFSAHEGPLNDPDGPNEIAGWDSLNHLNLIMALQNEFQVEFDFEDVMGIKVVGDIKAILAKKTQ